MNRKGQTGPIGAIFLFIVFVVNWFIWMGAWLGEVGTAVITENHLTGVEAFFISNLNFVVFIAVILGMIGWVYFGGRQ